MKPRDRITAAIRSAKQQGRPALVPYLTSGFPKREEFRAQLMAIASNSAVVEVGVPFTDPMADGATIQRSSRAALEQGVTLRWILSEISALSPKPPAPLLLFSYLNPLLSYGLARLASEAVKAGVSGFIVPDLPLEESGDLQAAFDVEGLALIQLVTPITPAARLKQLCEASQGFVYAVTMTGTTGKDLDIPPEVVDYLDRVKAVSPLPVCAGFGIRGPAQVAKIAAHVDGVVVGSALVEVLERGEDPVKFLRGLVE
jgi:tryptophan synthase alpha chain